MSPIDAIKRMMETSGVGPSDLSRRIGKARTYISSTIAHGSVPRVDTMARIAHECGYRLFLVGDGGSDIELYADSEENASVNELLDRIPEIIEAHDLANIVNGWLAESGKLYRFSDSDAEYFAIGVAAKAHRRLTVTRGGEVSSGYSDF